jgi:hypothetical protein
MTTDADKDWIPVSERLPTAADGDACGRVWATSKNGHGTDCPVSTCNFTNGAWIAWRRLPKPYVVPRKESAVETCAKNLAVRFDFPIVSGLPLNGDVIATATVDLIRAVVREEIGRDRTST